MPTKQLQQWAAPHRVVLATNLVDLPFTLRVAIQQAMAYSAELQIVHVLPDPDISQIDPVLLVNCEPEQIYKAAETILIEALATAVSCGVRCGFHLVAGDVTNEIIKTARAWRADRLIAGSQGQAKFHLHILGSVAESLFHHIEIPVLAIGPHALPENDPAKERMRIVLATRLDRNSRRMAAFALDIAEKHHADISLVYVAPEIAQEHPTAARVTGYAKRMLNNLLDVRPLKKCRPSCEVLHGEPAQEILKNATRHAADMIVLGASPHCAFDPRFVPGTAYRVLCEAPCPVLVLKQDSAWISPQQDAARHHSTQALTVL